MQGAAGAPEEFQQIAATLALLIAPRVGFMPLSEGSAWPKSRVFQVLQQGRHLKCSSRAVA